MMSDKEFAELELRATICPQQCRWPKPESVHWQKLHEAVNEARKRVSKAYVQMDEIDRNADLSREGKERQRRKAAAQAVAGFEASKTLARAREAVRYNAADVALKVLEQVEHGWQRAIDMILERAAQTKAPRTRAVAL